MSDVQMVCPECNRKYDRRDMTFSKDCHGIPFRLLCFGCIRKIYKQKGYDGQYYTEADEYIEPDW